jgi:site-specific recombinase XerD
MKPPPAWLRTFLDRLEADDLSAATRRGYRYDLLQFVAWYTGLNGVAPRLARLTEHDLITWRQHMVTQGGLKAASTNRRLEAVRRLLRWAEANGMVTRNIALKVKSVRIMRERRPLGLTVAEVHGLLRAAGETSHRFARRNYALVQVMLQTGLRVGEVAAWRRGGEATSSSATAPCHSRRSASRARDRRAATVPIFKPVMLARSWYDSSSTSRISRILR